MSTPTRIVSLPTLILWEHNGDLKPDHICSKTPPYLNWQWTWNQRPSVMIRTSLGIISNQRSNWQKPGKKNCVEIPNSWPHRYFTFKHAATDNICLLSTVVDKWRKEDLAAFQAVLMSSCVLQAYLFCLMGNHDNLYHLSQHGTNLE